MARRPAASNPTTGPTTGPGAHRRSICPVACTLDLIGDRWTLLIIRDMLVGKARYKEFLASPERISTNILADRLARLVEAGIVSTRPSDERRGSDLYELTDKGRDLQPVLEAAMRWGLTHVPGTEARLAPPAV